MMQYIGDVIRRYRKAAGMSQADLAKLSGVDQTHISKIEQGERMPSVELLSQLTRCLRIPPAELMHFDDTEMIPLTEFAQDTWKHEQELTGIVRELNVRRKQKVLTYAQEQLKLMSLKRGRPVQAE